MTTLKDIARLTGVSVNTVSRALRDMPDIGDATKERIRRVADTLDYTPNAIARGLVLKRTFVIGALVTELGNPSRSMLIRELRRLLGKQGYQLLIESYDTGDEVSERLRTMTSRGVDGLLIGNIDGILAEQEYWPDLQSILQSGIPVVVFFHAITTKVDNIVCDYADIAAQLTRHLIETHGLRGIVYTGENATCSRAMGYRRAMEGAGLEAQIGFIPLPYWSMRETRDAMVAYLHDHPAPEAIVCHNDLTAMGIMAGLRKVGLKVPDDIAIVGTDNIEMAEIVNPTLTTAGFDPNLMAHKIFTLLTDRIEHEKSSRTAQQVNLDFNIFLRESCGCSGDYSPKPPRT